MAMMEKHTTPLGLIENGQVGIRDHDLVRRVIFVSRRMNPLDDLVEQKGRHGILESQRGHVA